MAYFKNIHSLAELKKEYRRLALENHPDKGGSTEVMQQINVEFERLHEIWKNDTTVSANASGYENHRIVSWLGLHQGELTAYIVLHTLEFLSVIAPREDIAVGTDSREPLAVCLVQVLLNPLAVNLVGAAVTR